MKKRIVLWILLAFLLGMAGCAAPKEQVQIAATTLPVYEFTEQLCAGTGITVGLVVTEAVSCLHDYSLQTRQMGMIEGAELVVISGAGLEDFLELEGRSVADASAGIPLLCPEAAHQHQDSHHHDFDPHIWLSPENAKGMCKNICHALSRIYPEHTQAFEGNLAALLGELDALQAYGDAALTGLKSRELITFHDGFAYFAQAFDLTILKAVEEESGSEASASELIELIRLVQGHRLPAIFTEENGSTSAAQIIAAETGIPICTLDMGMGSRGYFEMMYHNIDTIKEALE